MQIHASCVSRDGAGVLLQGPPGSGKSDLVLRLLDCGFELAADDRVEIENGWASPPDALAGLLEVRGLGVLIMAYKAPVRLILAVELSSLAFASAERLPAPRFHPFLVNAGLALPVVIIDPAQPSAPARVGRALDCALGVTRQVAGAFAP